MTVTSKITLDLTRPNIGAAVHAVQGDGNTRCVEITLLSGGSSWEPPADAEVAIAYRQPAMAKGLYNKLADGSPAISVSGNVASIVLAPQMLTVSGTVQASLVFSDAQLNRLTTFPFAVSVTSNPAIGAQQTEDYIRLQWLEDKLDEWVQQMMSTEKAVAAAAAAERADTAAVNAREQAAAAGSAATAANTAAALANQAKTDAETAASDAASAAEAATTAALGADAARDAANQAAAAARAVVDTVAPDVNLLKDDINDVCAELGRTAVNNLIYDHYVAPKTYSISINGANPTFDRIAKDDGGMPVKAGSRYLVHYDVVFDPISTIQQGSINIQFRENGTSTTVNAIESGSPWTFDAYSSKGKTFGEFICSFDSDQMVYLFLFGTGGVAGTELHFTVSNFYMVEITEDTPEDYIRRSFGSIYIAEAETYLRVTGFDRRITALENGSAANTIVCWGDSLTMGAGSGDYNRNTYPAILGTKLPDFEVVNYGVGGETSDTIMGRQGSAPMIVNPFTVPADTSAVEVTISTDSNVPMCPLRQMSLEDKGLNPCAIGGILGNLSYSDGKYYFSRAKSGESLEISRPQMIITNAMQKDMLRSPYCMIIWVGTNDGYSGDEGASPFSEAITLKAKISQMVDYAGCKRYIVLGFVEGQRSKWETINKILGFAFGGHYLNIREYLCKYGLDDNEITPTDTDASNISIGRVPQSLRSDGIHLNQSGYGSVANAVFERGKQLGYW